MNQQFSAPPTQPAKTVSLRNVDPLLLTLPARARNVKTKIGFEIKSTYGFNEDQPYVLVGFDFSSQESAYAAMLAASRTNSKLAGEDSFDKALLVGNKEDGTDFHSATAKMSGLSRTLQKNLNYSSAYGGKWRSQSKIIAGARPDLTLKQAEDLAKKANSAFVGKKDRTTGLYKGGIASNYFNFNVCNIESGKPKVPVFGTPYPRSLQPDYNNKINSGTPAANNASIQSGCANAGMLSLILLYIDKQIEDAGISEYTRYAVSIHDENHYICHEDYTEQLAKCMVRAHAQMWAYFAYRLNLMDYPIQRLFFDITIDVSKILRKEANQKIKTATFSYEEMGYQYYVSRKTGKLTRRDFN